MQTNSNVLSNSQLYNNQIQDNTQLIQSRSVINGNGMHAHPQIELQNIRLEPNEQQEHQQPDSEREEDLRNLVGILLGKVQLKRMEPALLVKLQTMDQFYDLLPFNIRGFKLVNRASLLEANFSDKYILKQTQDLNLDLHKGQFEKHYLVDAALKIVKNTPCWSYFVSIILVMMFLLQLTLDPILMGLIELNQPAIDEEIERLKGIAHTSRDDELQADYENETLAIDFLIPLLSIRLILWFLNLLLRFVALHFFRKKYILWTLLLDFIMICITVVIGGFTTRLDSSLEDNNQSRVELLIRNFVIFVLFIVAMIQARKALGVIKRLSLLYTQQETACCNFSVF